MDIDSPSPGGKILSMELYSKAPWLPALMLMMWDASALIQQFQQPNPSQTTTIGSPDHSAYSMARTCVRKALKKDAPNTSGTHNLGIG